MNLTPECIPCFLRQAVAVSRLVGADGAKQERVVKRILALLSEVPFDQTPPQVATVIHSAIREELGMADPYREAKERSNILALGLCPQLRELITGSSDPFATAVRLAIAGNIIDFGQGCGVDGAKVRAAIAWALEQPLPPDVLEPFRSAVGQAESILYLGDNAGEVVFDRLLIELLPRGKVTFAVRGGPILNDATTVDAEVAGIHELAAIVDNGSNAPGTILLWCSPRFQERFHRADLIIAKGQGNYETLSAVNAPIHFLLEVKCPVIANHLGCDQGTLVLRRAGSRA